MLVPRQVEGLHTLVRRADGGERAVRGRGKGRRARERQLRCLPMIDVEPYDYQKAAATAVLSEMRRKALIADDVGLGKTIEAGLI